MKNLYMIGGTMGVGKTTVSQILKNKLQNVVFLDGDWCWNSNPFIVNDETRSIVMENIIFLLNQFIKSTAYDNIIFCWVMHKQEIMDSILSKIDIKKCNVINISLVCSEKTLRERLEKDINLGIRNNDILENSIERIPMYEKLNTIKINTDNKSIEEIVKEIICL